MTEQEKKEIDEFIAREFKDREEEIDEFLHALCADETSPTDPKMRILRMGESTNHILEILKEQIELQALCIKWALGSSIFSAVIAILLVVMNYWV